MALAPKLLDRVRERIRLKHYSIRTEKSYVQWIRRFILFHSKRHPVEMGAVEVEAFLTHLVVEGKGEVLANLQGVHWLVAALLYGTGVRWLHEKDLADGLGEVYLPYALERKYPGAAKAWGWQYVFPSGNLSGDPRTGKMRRHHLDEQTIQRAVK